MMQFFSKNKLVANISAQECFFLTKKRFPETIQIIKKKSMAHWVSQGI